MDSHFLPHITIGAVEAPRPSRTLAFEVHLGITRANGFIAQIAAAADFLVEGSYFCGNGPAVYAYLISALRCQP